MDHLMYIYVHMYVHARTCMCVMCSDLDKGESKVQMYSSTNI